MRNDRFLTVFAVFDDKTQKTIHDWQEAIAQRGLAGSQSADIPFHISLGSFPVDMQDELLNRLRNAKQDFRPFELTLDSICTFGDKVLYLQPSISTQITELHDRFAGNYADGLPFVAHSTVFMGAVDEVLRAKAVLQACFTPIRVTVTELWLCEFFPTRFIGKEKLSNYI